MRGLKLYLCAGLMIAITALRVCFPAESGRVRDWVVTTLDPRGGVKAAVMTLGQELDSSALREGLTAVMARIGGERA